MTSLWKRRLALACCLSWAVAQAAASAAPVTISGELKQWHKVTLTLDGPFAREPTAIAEPVPGLSDDGGRSSHESGSPRYRVPGYFAADGNAARPPPTRGQVARAPLPRQDGPLDLPRLVLAGKQAAVDDAAASLAPGRPRRLDGLFVIGADGQDRAATSARAGPAAVRRQTLPAIRRHRRVLPQGRRRRPREPAGYADFDGTHSAKARHGGPTKATPLAEDLAAARRGTGGPAIRPGRAARARA